MRATGLAVGSTTFWPTMASVRCCRAIVVDIFTKWQASVGNLLCAVDWPGKVLSILCELCSVT